MTIRAIPTSEVGHRYEALIPLYHFGLDVDRISLSEFDTIERYSPQSFQALLADWSEFRDYLRLFPPDYVLRVCFRDDKDILVFQPIDDDEQDSFAVFLRGDQERIARRIEDVITAFRLFQQGFFCHGGQWLIATGTLTIGEQTTTIGATRSLMSGDTSIGSLSSTEDGNFCYYLDSAQVDSFCEFRARIEADLEDLRFVPRIRLALDYLMSSYSMRHPANHVVNLFISLEAMVKQAPEESSNRLFKRVANLLGRNRVEANEVYETVKRYYVVRCAVVHGSVLDGYHDVALARHGQLRELVRRAFLVSAALGKRFGFGPEFYAAVDDLDRDPRLKKSVQQDAFRGVAAVH